MADTPAATPPVAIVGLACRFPDADDAAAMLELVLTQRRAFRRLPTCRVDVADYYSPDPSTPDATYSTRAGVLEGWQFDRAAFGITPAEYMAADPAQWLALETAARALTAAGFPGGKGLYRSRVGVILGNTLTGDVSRATGLRLRWPFVRNVLADALIAAGIPREQGMPVLRHAAARYLAPFPEVSMGTLGGSLPASIAARICGYFGFQGGGHTVDSASSSSLVAVASACSALAAGDLDVVLAGGVDVSLDPFELVGLAKTGVLAAGDMRVYDANPTGFLPGEGCGVVVLMRAAEARAAGQPIFAEIAGWGVSSAGQPSLTASDPGSQLLAMRRAYDRAGVDPADVQLVEGHGTGTATDDFAELTALAELRRGARQPAALGSIKANIGHAKAAAGAAGLIKTVLVMGSDLIPPTTGASTPHPLLLGSQGALYLPDRAVGWPEGPRIAAVSAMDPGGANAHLVLSSEPVQGSRHERGFRVIPRGSRAGATDGGNGTAGYGTAGPGTGGSSMAGTVGRGSRVAVYLLQAPDRDALAAGLARIADIAPWMADAELHDLACQLASEADDPGPARVAIVASRQEQLARLAREAITMLPGLGGSWFAARPGIFAADGEPGQVTLLLSAGTAPAGPAGPPPAMGAELSALAWLDLMGVRATTAMGQGLGEIAGLAWAESLPEADATRLARRCGEILGSPAVSPADADDRAARLRMLLTQFVFAPPRRRLISAAIGRQVMSPADIAEALCAQLSRPDRLEEALLEAAVDADLLVETGPGQALSAAAAQCCDVQAVSLGMGAGGAPAPRAIAALFAVGALGRPQSLYAGEPARPIDIWRERIFITSPCQLLPPRPAGVHSVPRPGGEQPESPAGTHPAGMVTATTGPKPAVPPAAIRHVATRAVTTPSGTAPQAIAAQATAAQAATTLPPAAAPLAATPQATAPSQTTASPVTESQATALPGAAAPPATAGTPRATAPLRPTIPSRAATAAWVAAATQAGPVPQAANTAQAAAAPQAATAQRVARPAGALPGVAAGASHAESQVTDRAVQEARAHRAGLALPAHVAGAQRHPVADPPRGGIPSSQDPQSSQDLQPGQDAQSSWSPWPGQDTESRQSAGASQLTGTSQSSGAGQLTGDGTDAAGLTSEEKHRRAQVPVIARAITTARRNPAKAAGPAEAHGATQTPGTAGEAEQTGQPEQITDTGQTTGTAQTAGTGQTTETAITTGTTDVTQAPMVTGAVAAASASRSGQAMAAEAATAGIATWTRCFAEELRLPRESLPLADGQPWRVWAAANHPFGIIAPELFPDRPGAGRTLAVLGAPNDPGACATALSAARDAVRTGQLVVISPSAGFTGFWASLHAEHPSMGITLIRVRAGSDGLRAASQYAAVTPGKFRELSIDHAGQPREAVMAPVPVPGGGTFPLGPEDVVLVSRGTQGAGLALAQVLACCGAPVAVIGEAGPDEDSKLVAGLERLRLAGARVIFETVDPTGPASLAAAMHRIQRKLGPVTAVGHAAPPAPPRLATELTEGELAAHVGTGAAGLQQLLSCIRTDRLRLIATFGSVAGRYGMAGESLLALASGAFAEQAERLSDAIPGCRALHIDWPGWAGSGLGERAGLAAGMARAKIAPLQVREGSRLLLKMLATPGLPGRIAVHGRIGAVAPAVIAAAGPTVAAPGVPGSPGGRFLENLLVHYPGIELVADARLALSTDPYLAEHRLDGELLLPAALALEAMAQAASALAGRPLHRAKGVSAVAPVLIPDSEPGSSTVIRICALRDGDTVWTAVRCAETGFDVDHFRAAFYCGEDEVPVVPVEAGPGELDDTDEPATHVGSARIIDGSELYGPVCFQSGRFRRVAFLPEISARGCRALASGSDDQPWFSGSGGQASAPLILGNPGLNDATMHVLQACVPHRRLTVAGCESVTFSGRETDGVAEIRAVATPTAGSQPAAKRPAGKQLAGKPPAGDPPAGGVPAVAQAEALGSTAAPSSPQPVPQQRSSGPRAAGPPADYCWDVDAVDLAGNLLVSWRGLRFRDGGPLTRTAAWPPLLLSVYLERCATALGLEDGLRVRVLCTQAEPAGETLAGAAGSLAPDSGPEAITLKVGPAPSAAGSWQLADPAGADPVRGPGLGSLRDRLAQRLGESPARLNARIRAIVACLPAAEQLADAIVIDDMVNVDWVVLRAGEISVACTMADVSGVALPVAIALATGISAGAGAGPDPGGVASPPPGTVTGAGPAGAGLAAGGAGLPWVWLQAAGPSAASPAASSTADSAEAGAGSGPVPGPGDRLTSD